MVGRVLREIARNKSSKSKSPAPVTDEEYDALVDMQKILKPLAKVTTEISSEKYVTLSKIIPLVNGIQEVSILF